MRVNPKDLELFDDRIIVKVDNREERLKSGLYLPPSPKEAEKPKTGVIVNLGYQANKDRITQEQLELGEHVIFGKYAGIEMEDELGDDEHIIMRAQDIIGRFKPEA